VRGPRRDILFINECNNVSFETYTQLAIRTNEDNYADLCPDEVMKVRIQLWCQDIWQELEDMGD
jgi:phage terminase large subunit